MVCLLGSRATRRKLPQFVCLLLLSFVQTISLFAQATPCCGTEWSNPSMPGTTWNQPNSGSPQSSGAQWGPFGNSNPGTIMNAPNPNLSPTRDQTQWYLNNHPAFASLDSATKTNIANVAAPFLHTPNLPNGERNPFYQNGQLTPNWYVPSTWSSPTMSWQGVQPNGYMPNTYSTYSSYNPSSFSNYNRSSNTANYNVQSYQPNYNPPPVYRPNIQPSQSVPPLAQLDIQLVNQLVRPRQCLGRRVRVPET